MENGVAAVGGIAPGRRACLRESEIIDQVVGWIGLGGGQDARRIAR